MAQLRLRVAKADAATPRIRALTLVSEDGGPLPGFSPGAHVRVALPDGGDRPYSLINADPGAVVSRGAGFWRLGVLLEEESKGGSRYMHGLAEGDIITVAPPKNDFSLEDHAGTAILIAGGIGVTPIVSMAAELARAGRPFEFHYAGRSRPLLAFADEIAAVCGDALTIHCDDEPGTCLDLAALVRSCPSDAHLYVCGPRGMIEAARELAHAQGFAKEQVHFELFDQPQEEAGDKPFEVVVSSTGQSFTVPPGRSIIEVLEEGGVDLVYDCQRGDCGICQTGVLEGVPDHRDVILTDDERAANDVMQICVSRAKSQKLVLDL